MAKKIFYKNNQKVVLRDNEKLYMFNMFIITVLFVTIFNFFRIISKNILLSYIFGAICIFIILFFLIFCVLEYKNYKIAHSYKINKETNKKANS